LPFLKRIFRRKNLKGLEESLLAIKNHLTTEEELERLPIVLKGQYKEAYETLDNAINAGLIPALVGPPGVGKSLLARRYAQDTGRPFYEIFFDETMKPSSLIGYFDPAITMKKGYCLEAFIPGPLSKAMVEGGIFLAQELNRATEYCQNTLLAPLEERRYYIPRLGHIKADENFVLIAAMNPAELGGTYRLSEALKDRIGVWIPLGYPSKEVEIEIIKVNSPEYRIEEYVFELIYSVINKARSDKRFDSPSIRDGIAIARMLGEIKNKKGTITNEDIVLCASCVLRINMKNELESEYRMREFVEECIR
jgi:MoxR-like ATPase